LLKNPKYPKGRSLSSLASGINLTIAETEDLLKSMNLKQFKLKKGGVGYRIKR